MARYCSICGRELKKSEGPIGPKCLQKIKPRNIRTISASKLKAYAEMAAKFDLYSEDIDGQEETGETGESSKG